MYSLRWACKRTNCQILCVVFDMLLKGQSSIVYKVANSAAVISVSFGVDK